MKSEYRYRAYYQWDGPSPNDPFGTEKTPELPGVNYPELKTIVSRQPSRVRHQSASSGLDRPVPVI